MIPWYLQAWKETSSTILTSTLLKMIYQIFKYITVFSFNLNLKVAGVDCKKTNYQEHKNL